MQILTRRYRTHLAPLMQSSADDLPEARKLVRQPFGLSVSSIIIATGNRTVHCIHRPTHVCLLQARVNRRRKIHAAFTLVEVVVVLAILAMAAAMTSIRYSGPMRRARVEGAIQQWISIDQFARQEARKADTLLEMSANENSTLEVKLRSSEGIRRSWTFDSRVNVRWFNQLEAIALITFSKRHGSIDYKVSFADGPINETIIIAGGSGLASRINTR